jgi:aspartate racemase
MKTLGIIGGIGPESTIEYYRQIIALYRQKKADGSYPPIIINSINMQKMLDLVAANSLDELTEFLVNEIVKLARAGADLALLSSNTPHVVFDNLSRQSPLPMISIIESACEEAQRLYLKKLALLGTRFTMQGSFYSGVFSRHGIALVVPSGAEQDYIHEKYMGELVNGLLSRDTRTRLLAVVERLRKQENIDGVILGGTELPLILTEKTYQGIPFLDTTRIHVERAVEKMLDSMI